MFLTFLSTVSLPRDGDNTDGNNELVIYHLTWIMHITIFMTLLVNIYFAETLGLAKVTLNTCIMLFYVLFIIYICVEWIFPNKVELETKPEDEQDADEPEEEEDIFVELSQEQKGLIFWLQIEVLIFFANIISNMIYLLCRSCSRNRINIRVNAMSDAPDEGDDLLEQ